MLPIDFYERNKMFTAPPGKEDSGILDLPVFADGSQMVSCWQMTTEEKMMAAFFGLLWVGVVSNHLPPMWFATRRPFTDAPDAQFPDAQVVDNYIKRKIRLFMENELAKINLPGAHNLNAFQNEDKIPVDDLPEILENFLNFTFKREKPTIVTVCNACETRGINLPENLKICGNCGSSDTKQEYQNEQKTT